MKYPSQEMQRLKSILDGHDPYIGEQTNNIDDQKKQLKKASLILNHCIYKESVEEARLKLGISKEGFSTDMEAYDWFSKLSVKATNSFQETVFDLMSRFNTSKRWLLVFAYNVLRNNTDIPLSVVPNSIEMYIPNDRDKLVLSIFKDTSLEDLEANWKLIQQQLMGLKPDKKTRSNSKKDVLVWNEKSGEFILLQITPARKKSSLSDLYKKGELIRGYRKGGYKGIEIARKMKLTNLITGEDVAKVYDRYKNILDTIVLY